MYLVIGNSPKKVELKDLKDCVYYKQQKVYSDDQYRKSPDLQDAIKRKNLIVLKQLEDKNASFDIPTIGTPTKIEINNSSSDRYNMDELLERIRSSSPDIQKFDQLMERIQNLEKALQKKGIETDKSFDGSLIEKLLNRLEKLENSFSSSSNNVVDSTALDAIQESLKSLEAKIHEKSKGDDILEKLEGIIIRSGTVSVQEKAEEEERRIEDIYVPNITVEDGNSHINLEVRTVEKSDNVNDSLKKLKELKSKSK